MSVREAEEKLKVPTPAQDRVRRGPFAALLILLSLVLGPAAAAAGGDYRGPAPRLGSGRHTVATALVPSTARNPLDDEASGGGDPFVLPPRPSVVTEPLQPRPGAGFAPRAGSATPPSAVASYWARAPPAA